jgi:sec-independent protein translocase protein TatA
MRNLRKDDAGLLEGLDLIIVLIIIAVLFLFGPSKIPDIFRSIGRALGEFRRGRMEVEREISQQFSQLEAQDSRGKIERAAGALGLTPTGKSELQVKLDIARAVDKAPDGQVVAAAQTLGVYNADADMTTLKEKIIKSLNV